MYELLSVNDEIRSQVHRGAAENEVRDAALRTGMHSMRDDGNRWVEAGLTSLDEVIRVTRD